MIKSLIKSLFKMSGYQIARLTPTSKAINITISAPEHILDLNKKIAKQPVIKLHIGCGPRILKDWFNIDLKYEPFENYLQYYTDKHYPIEIRGNQDDFYALDVTKVGIPLPNESVDIIFHEDFIEHLNQRDTITFLAEALRVLKKGGLHRVNTPNLTTSMQINSRFEKGISGVYVEEWNMHGHLNVLTPAYLEELAKLVGYSKVLFNARNKSTSQMGILEYRPDPNDRNEEGNIFADLVK